MQIVLSSIPVAVLVIALVGLKLPAWKAALAAFAVCAAEAFALRGVGLSEIASCSLKGASTGLFPIGLIIVAALFTYAVVVESGAEEEIKSGLSSLSGDKRYLALLIAWGFGNFMEGMAGFGTAVAIPCAIMMGVGFDPLKAILCCLVANTTPTAFASVGVPTFVLASETGLNAGRLASAIGFVQLAVAFASPFLILFITDGLRGLRERWWLALVAAASFIVPWLSLAAWAGCELPNIAGSVATLFVLALMGDHSRIDMQRQRRAWCPFAIVVAALGASAFLPARVRLREALRVDGLLHVGNAVGIDDELPQHGRVQLHEEPVEVGVAGVRHDHLRAEVGGACERFLEKHARQRAFVLVVMGELMELGVSARRADGHGTVSMHGIDGHAVESALEARDLLGHRAEAELQRVEAKRDRLVGDGGAVVEAPVVPVCREGEAHGVTRGRS